MLGANKWIGHYGWLVQLWVSHYSWALPYFFPSFNCWSKLHTAMTPHHRIEPVNHILRLQKALEEILEITTSTQVRHYISCFAQCSKWKVGICRFNKTKKDSRRYSYRPFACLTTSTTYNWCKSVSKCVPLCLWKSLNSRKSQPPSSLLCCHRDSNPWP